MYKREQVIKSSTEYFKGDSLAAEVWTNKYCLKDKQGNLLEQTPDDMHRRLAKEFARIESNYPNPLTEEEIYNLIKDFKYIIPQGSPMYGIGNNYSLSSLSNCYVVGDNNEADSYGSIMRTDEEIAQIYKRRGGCGITLDHYRPAFSLANGSVLNIDAGSTLYMERFSNTTREVAQSGRRGALMETISIKHPDAELFIDKKLNLDKVTGANISVKLSDEFLGCVKNDADFIQVFPVSSDSSMINIERFEYDKLYKWEEFKNHDHYNGNEPQYFKKIRAKKLWDKIIFNAWRSAEPGLLFWDKILDESPAGVYGKEWKEISTNPCSELPLCEYDSCRLLSINLYSYIEHPFTSQAQFNFELFKSHVNKAQRLMDDLVDLEIEKVQKIVDKIKSDPESEDIKRVELNLWNKIKQKAIDGRRTGLGITAEGDMLAALNMRYGSEVAINFSEDVHKVMAVESYKSSIDMAKERGAFPIWDFNKEVENPFLNRVFEHLTDEEIDTWQWTGRRNIANLTIAPTGSVSICTQTTSGIEPLYRPFYKRRTKTENEAKATFIDEVGDKWEEYYVIHPKFKTWFDLNWYKLDYKWFDIDYHPEIEELSEEQLESVFKKSPYYQATANDIDWVSSVEMQGRVQKWIDHSISKTVNLPKETTVETVNQIYMKGWESRCKGLTIYRDGSRSGVLIDTKNEEKRQDQFTYSKHFKRPKTTDVDIYHKTALGKDWTVLIGKVNGNPYEIFVIKQVNNHIFPLNIKSGTLTKVKSRTYKLEGIFNKRHYKIDNILDLMSDDERVNTRKYSSMLRQGMHPKYIYKEIGEFSIVGSFDKVVQRVLSKYIDENDEELSQTCPQCGSHSYHSEEGCWKCDDCGYARCG